MSNAVLQLDALTVRYGGVVALDAVDLAFGAAAVHGVIGPNGAGKTTLFDAVTGACAPQSGRVVLDGDDVTKWSSVQRARRGIRRTFQHEQVFGWLSVRENVEAGIDWRRLAARDAAQRVDAAVELCALGAVLDAPVDQLGLGVRRRIELARAVVDAPRVLLLDEPTAGVGESDVVVLAQAVERVVDAHGTCVILIEHDVDFVMDQAQRVVVLERGQVIADAAPDAVLADPRVQAAYLGVGPLPGTD
ncbi:MAG: ABC transporter ATP-binding protein [Acidimicrobiia bacterium]